MHRRSSIVLFVFAALLFACSDKAPVTQGVEFRTTEDFSRSIENLVAAGYYSWADPAITDALFPRQSNDSAGQADVVYDLVDMRGSASLEQAWAEMERRGLRKPTARDTLIYGEKNPDVQRRRPIIGGVSAPSAGGSVGVLVLYGDAGYRRLSLHWRRLTNPWNESYLFLAVRK